MKAEPFVVHFKSGMWILTSDQTDEAVFVNEAVAELAAIQAAHEYSKRGTHAAVLVQVDIADTFQVVWTSDLPLPAYSSLQLH